MTRRPIPAAFAVPVLVLAVAAVPPVAAAGPAPTPSAAATEVVSRHSADVVGDTTGFRAPTRVPAGVTHFRVSTSNPGGIRLGIFRLNDGVRLDTFVEHLRLALTGRGEEALAAGQAMAREAVLHGGVMTIPGRTATVSPVLMPGRYYLVDYLTVESATPVVRSLDVFGSDIPAQLAAVHAAVTIRDTPDGPRYFLPDRLRAGTVLRVSNHSRNLNEAVMVELRPGADAADVQRFFEIVDSGSWPTETPFARPLRPDGVPALSPGRSIAVEPALTPGRYAVVTWFPDEHGRMHAARGAFALFTVS